MENMKRLVVILLGMLSVFCVGCGSSSAQPQYKSKTEILDDVLFTVKNVTYNTDENLTYIELEVENTSDEDKTSFSLDGLAFGEEKNMGFSAILDEDKSKIATKEKDFKDGAYINAIFSIDAKEKFNTVLAFDTTENYEDGFGGKEIKKILISKGLFSGNVVTIEL